MRLMGSDSIAILPAAPVRQRNNDVEYNYRQDSDFYYLTGFSEPEAVAVLMPGRAAAEYVLFVRERNPRARDLGRQARRTRRRGRATTAPTTPFRSPTSTRSCPGLLEKRSRVFYTMGLIQEFDQRVVGWVNTLRAQARSGRTRRRSSWRSITCCTTCVCSRAAASSS